MQFICQVFVWNAQNPSAQIPTVNQHCHPNTWEVEAGGSEVKVILGYKVSLRPDGLKQMRLQFKIKVKVLVGLMETEAREEEDDLEPPDPQHTTCSEPTYCRPIRLPKFKYSLEKNQPANMCTSPVGYQV